MREYPAAQPVRVYLASEGRGLEFISFEKTPASQVR